MFRQHCTHLQFFVRPLFSVIPRHCSNKSKRLENDNLQYEVVSQSKLGASFFTKNIGSSYWKWYTILNKYPKLKTLKPKDVVNTTKVLRKFDFSLDDIMSKPMILFTNELTLENRCNVLKECGFDKMNISLLYKFVAVMNKNVVHLKFCGYIPSNLGVVEKLRQTFTDVEIKLCSKYPCNESMELKVLRQHMINYYLQQQLDVSDEQIQKLWKTYNRLTHRSFNSIQKMVNILLNELAFSKERIKKNAFIMYGDADNVQRILKEIPTLGGQDIKKILFRRPKIMMSSCNSLLAIIKHVKSFGLNEDSILRCLEILTLAPDTVFQRLNQLNEIEQFKVLNTNPRFLRLVHYQNKARGRLDYLKQLNVRCVSLHVLSCGSETFAKYVRDGYDRSGGRDALLYLSKIMDKSEQELRAVLARHPNWIYIPVLQIKCCYEFLLRRGFRKNDICNNLHLLLYATERIDEKLKELDNPDFNKVLNINQSLETLTNNKKLTLVLYLIEKEFHFTGDGIWTELHAQHVENFNNLLPDFPESLKMKHKYGTNPYRTNHQVHLEGTPASAEGIQ